ncbi:unnamed protein product [Ilex paraguariensis]|uniref:Uncharacterized protein n=1 Tax=Ilex paraguariensis TaxID=185542 RepID=A0ABC8V1U2_9AQUA
MANKASSTAEVSIITVLEACFNQLKYRVLAIIAEKMPQLNKLLVLKISVSYLRKSPKFIYVRFNFATSSAFQFYSFQMLHHEQKALTRHTFLTYLLILVSFDKPEPQSLTSHDT